MRDERQRLLDEVWSVVQDDLPALKTQVKAILEEMGPQSVAAD